MEKILKIEEINTTEGWSEMSGYAITTDEQVIKLMIDDNQSCCEQWGYFLSEYDVTQFIGSDLIELTLTDTALNTVKLKDKDMSVEKPYVYEGGIMFVNISTTKGLLQFCAYNEHNGYYGHDAKVVSTQLNHEECL